MLLALIAPISTLAVYVALYLNAATDSPVVVLGVGITAFMLVVVVAYQATERQQFEAFDTIRNFVFAHLIAARPLEGEEAKKAEKGTGNSAS